LASIDANPRLLFPDPDIGASLSWGLTSVTRRSPNGMHLRAPSCHFELEHFSPAQVMGRDAELDP
jgi:hypothetical protein